MEVLLDFYIAEHSDDQPLICMDEAVLELKGDVKQLIPIQLGHDAFIGLLL
ncbi:hypothetical protein [Okeania hirsuta]|uniref:hypothetical protein n=1 Tax=Okeania TaxID=1458928 RepID=UPI001374A11C|nr:hypothetical protein [Okeania sp. SIO4D6]NEP37924.1 hypothetical protein [Okeania sp. SIO2H7]NEP71110.1 hypothetical protein [Okeania sp. SIO2G5]NEP92024.1 hypothetical protein [Okeania sp. SIO2F5]NEQ90139.1 hypothetical protein [Okeania sp. SIO2G4]NES78209.1 hypothetical protein [Okeania sp. SIO1H4]NES89227.1 hypothetical protein [Okeania sp. SIO2B9]NET11504.1 hypothetical protein [Okeania sp. SIO1H6]NET18729.1 hypothetical protein [Okeania sp. SIO1H5]NET78358.1 hypothetical protein [O